MADLDAEVDCMACIANEDMHDIWPHTDSGPKYKATQDKYGITHAFVSTKAQGRGWWKCNFHRAAWKDDEWVRDWDPGWDP